jgi:hypothetical protein
MSTSWNHTKVFVQCCHDKHMAASSQTVLSTTCDCEEMTMESGIQLRFIHHVLTEMLEKERSLPAAWQCKTSYHTNYKNCSHQLQDRSTALPTCSPNTSPYLDLFPELKELLPGQCLQCLETMNACMTLHIRHLKSSGQLPYFPAYKTHWPIRRTVIFCWKF